MAAPFFLDKWAYTGTDGVTPNVKFFPFTKRNSPPALLVWLTLVTSDNLANSLDYSCDQTTEQAQLQKISDATNLTIPCIQTIRKQLTSPAIDQVGNQIPAAKVYDAFQTVRFSLHSINAGLYPKNNCPQLDHVLALAPSLANFIPTSDPEVNSGICT